MTLSQELESKGITFRSQTDTEVIANLIGFYLDQAIPRCTRIGMTTRMLAAVFVLHPRKRSVDMHGNCAQLNPSPHQPGLHHLCFQNMEVAEAMRKAFQRLSGTWGIVLVHKDDPQQIIAVRFAILVPYDG